MGLDRDLQHPSAFHRIESRPQLYTKHGPEDEAVEGATMVEFIRTRSPDRHGIEAADAGQRGD